MSTGKPLPDTTSALTAPFWRGLRQRRFMVQRCSSCDALRYPAAPVCPECLSSDSAWTEIEASGPLWSFVVYRRALSAAFGMDVPYAVGLVELEQGLQVLSRISAPLDVIEIGNQFRARYEDVSDDVTLLTWEPVTEGAGDHG
jgi:uncharacterized protein